MRGRLLNSRLVEQPQLTGQHAHRPAIRDDVVLGQQQHVIVVGQLDQADAHQRPHRQIERLAALCVDQRQQTRLGIVLVAQVNDWQRHDRARRRNTLPPLALDREKRGAQRLVAGHQLIETALQRGHLQRPAQAQVQGHVVSRIAAFHLRQKPQALLGRRQRVCLATRYSRDWWAGAALPSGAQSFGELLQHRGGKQG